MIRSLIVSALILSIFSGCTRKEYITAPRPHLQTWEVKPLDQNVTYEVVES